MWINYFQSFFSLFQTSMVDLGLHLLWIVNELMTLTLLTDEYTKLCPDFLYFDLCLSLNIIIFEIIYIHYTRFYSHKTSFFIWASNVLISLRSHPFLFLKNYKIKAFVLKNWQKWKMFYDISAITAISAIKMHFLLYFSYENVLKIYQIWGSMKKLECSKQAITPEYFVHGIIE